MSLSNRYHHTRSPDYPNDDSDSDVDLAVDELDPSIQSERNTSARFRVDDGRDVQGSGIHLQRLRPSGRLAGLLRHGPKYDNFTSDEEDEYRGLVDRAQQPSDGREVEEEQITPGPPRPTRPSSSRRLSQIWNKLQSTPRSQAEEDFDPSTNRILLVGRRQVTRFPPNVVSNAKYTPWSFLPKTLYNEFSFFFNLYFLLVALSQIVPALRIGYLSTYVAPLAFVLAITLGKEAVDDISRRRRDAEANSERFTVLQWDLPIDDKKNSTRRRSIQSSEAQTKRIKQSAPADDEEANTETTLEDGENRGIRFLTKPSRDLRVGDILKLGKDQRVPADAVILKSASAEANHKSDEDSGEAFIRTDQLDGETDWKLRLAPVLTQSLNISDFKHLRINASKPEKNVNEFVGSLTHEPGIESDSSSERTVPLTIDNTAWANTVLASNASVFAVVVYTGPQTRQALSTSASRSKTGLLEYEINSLTKILCALTLVLSVVLVALERYESTGGRKWYIAVMRFLILFSTIVPISLRVNLDMGKSVYAWFIHRDLDMPGTVVRTSTIPEDLGRVEYLLSDKTGTLTQNDMRLKKIHVGTVSYANEAMSEVATYIRQGFADATNASVSSGLCNTISTTTMSRNRREIGSRVRDLVIALALCHNVTPTTAKEDGEDVTTYQASSPDEIAILKWTEDVGLRLSSRDRHQMTLESTDSGSAVVKVEILNIFPFTSESKRMGVILKSKDLASNGGGLSTEHVWFLQKGADTVMSSIVASNDWLDEETANMAREGLRTLVVGRKKMSLQTYQEFAGKFREASVSLHNRDEDMARVVKKYLEQDLELLGVTGVEDKLQRDVKPSLELLRNAGIKIWMLTGDKVETARCVAISAKLVARGQYIHSITKRKHDRIKFRPV